VILGEGVAILLSAHRAVIFAIAQLSRVSLASQTAVTGGARGICRNCPNPCANSCRPYVPVYCV